MGLLRQPNSESGRGLDTWTQNRQQLQKQSQLNKKNKTTTQQSNTNTPKKQNQPPVNNSYKTTLYLYRP
jgi:hypothetical protein